MSLRERVRSLVGWRAHAPRIKTSEAYDVVYRHLYNLERIEKGAESYINFFGRA